MPMYRMPLPCPKLGNGGLIALVVEVYTGMFLIFSVLNVRQRNAEEYAIS